MFLISIWVFCSHNIYTTNSKVLARASARDGNRKVREIKGNKKIVQIVWPFFLVLIQFLLATASRFVCGSKKYVTLQRGLGKCTQWQVPIHDGVPSIADPWFQYLHEKKLMAGDEVVFYFRFDDHAWEFLIRKDIEWDEEDIHLDDWLLFNEQIYFVFLNNQT